MRMLEKQLLGYRLATAEILYRLPDHPDLLQSFVWQTLDLAPEFPEVRRFLLFWTTNIDGKIHSVRVAHAALVKPAELRYVNDTFQIH